MLPEKVVAVTTVVRICRKLMLAGGANEENLTHALLEERISFSDFYKMAQEIWEIGIPEYLKSLLKKMHGENQKA